MLPGCIRFYLHVFLGGEVCEDVIGNIETLKAAFIDVEINELTDPVRSHAIASFGMYDVHRVDALQKIGACIIEVPLHLNLYARYF
jgi:hypothetical protein